MWNNSQWEQENQELLKEWYLDKVTGKAPDSAVRKIHCEGCGGIFYTRIHSKRYCNCVVRQTGLLEASEAEAACGEGGQGVRRMREEVHPRPI